MTSPQFRTQFDPRYGEATQMSAAPLVRRLTANNPGAYTFHGTNSYLTGDETVALIDPGPADAAHLQALEAAVGNRTVSHILLTHDHPDHIDGLTAAKTAFGAPVFALRQNPGVDVLLQDGDELSGPDWSLTAVFTPGHAGDHLCFALDGTDILFSGDHVMGWNSSVILPPDGSLNDYLASIDRLQTLPQDTYLPGHGGEVANGRRFARALKSHRLMRHEAVLKALSAEPLSLGSLVKTIYPSLKQELTGAAMMTLTAHLQALEQTGEVQDRNGIWHRL